MFAFGPEIRCMLQKAKGNEGASVQEVKREKTNKPRRVLGYVESFHFTRHCVSFDLDSLLRIGELKPTAVAGRRVLCLGGGPVHA